MSVEAAPVSMAVRAQMASTVTPAHVPVVLLENAVNSVSMLLAFLWFFFAASLR